MELFSPNESMIPLRAVTDRYLRVRCSFDSCTFILRLVGTSRATTGACGGASARKECRCKKDRGITFEHLELGVRLSDCC